MKKKHFDELLKSVGEATAHARGERVPGLRVHVRSVDRSEVATVRLKAGLTQAQFAEVLGASVGTVRKWEIGERSPSGAAATLIRVLGYDPTIVSKALGFSPGPAKRMPRSRIARRKEAV
ncbi:MAG TPA: helix-turn-helix domain-containing protein [Xanthobacteraceae bacterium]|nr:helix-turn-helix domain-containing protein [Xanthobacteraceae bacterium]